MTKIPKDSYLSCAIWLSFLSINAEEIVSSSPIKYKTIEDFKACYDFSDHTLMKGELLKLYQIANWMNIFFQFVPAKKNKGLCMQVVPKLVEGTYVPTGKNETPLHSKNILRDVYNAISPFFLFLGRYSREVYNREWSKGNDERQSAHI